MKTIILILLFSFILIKGEEIVDTEYGKVRGIVEKDFRVFKGTPYIAPPIGNLRFAAPQPHKPWAPLIFNATKSTPGCPQHCILPEGTCPSSYSEDCVFLHIFTPRVKNIKQLLPVMVYFHGGNFQQGSSGHELYDGREIVKKGIIWVNIGYRLGALGWMAEESLGLEGNYGLMDQRFALQWIKRNIANFGGNPNDITAVGQSAGGYSIAAHLISQKSKGLFHKAIMESVPFVLPFRNKASASRTGKLLLKELNCTNLECLRSKKAEEIVEAGVRATKVVNQSEPLVTFLPWTPTIDGHDITQQFIEAVQKGQFHKMPMIFGTVEDEGLIFIHRGFPDYVNDVTYIAAVWTVFAGVRLKVLSWYPPKPRFGDKRPQMSILATDYVFLAPTRHIMHNIRDHQSDPVWFYHMNIAFSWSWGKGYEYCDGKACHGVNIPYLFKSAPQLNSTELKLANHYMDYYTNFAKNGDPNKGANVIIGWPDFKRESSIHLQFTFEKISPEKEMKKKEFDFWDSIGYKWGTGH